MPPATSSPMIASSETTSPAAPLSPTSTSPDPTSPAHVNDAPLKATDTGVKKPAQKKKQTKHQLALKAKLNMQKMHAFFKAHRGEDKYEDMSFQEIQKALGKLWKASLENPKNNGA